MSSSSLMNTYGRVDIAFTHGENVWLYDEQGNKYLDAISGIGVCALGHAYPAVTEAISQQAAQVLHTSNLYRIPVQEQLAEALVKVSGMEKVFFANSGAEANEAAIKLARLHGHQQKIDVPAIIVMEQSFHGRTLATLTASGNRKVQAGFEPLVAGFVRAPFNDIEALQNIANNNSNVVAILIEPIQGEGGLHQPDDEYLTKVRELCDQNNWLMMLDEVQTGNARTGKYFAYQHDDFLPDVVTTAKGLGNGVPIGACLAQGKAAQLFQPGNHGSTFGGNPLACAAALAVVNTISEQDLCNKVTQSGEKIRTELQKRLAGCDHLVEIRGKGLMIGIELNTPCTELVQQAAEKGVLINVVAEKVVRLLPPLIIDEEQSELLIQCVVDLIKAL